MTSIVPILLEANEKVETIIEDTKKHDKWNERCHFYRQPVPKQAAFPPRPWSRIRLPVPFTRLCKFPPVRNTIVPSYGDVFYVFICSKLGGSKYLS